MFGGNDNNQAQPAADAQAVVAPDAQVTQGAADHADPMAPPPLTLPPTDDSQIVQPQPQDTPQDAAPQDTPQEPTVADAGDAPAAPAEPAAPALDVVEPSADAAPAEDLTPTLNVPTSNTSQTPSPTTDVDELLDIKQNALQQLTPLVNHLDQTPEERFRTTMMMIQASDNDNLLKDAFESAQQITDDKTRAQALLDVVNEINYFTQHNGSNTQPDE